MYREILLLLDGSHCAEKAIPHAKEVARRFEARLTLIVVIERSHVKAQMTDGMAEAAEPQLSHELMGRYLGSIAERIAADGLEVQTELLEDHGAEAALDYARTHQAQLIVFAAHSDGDASVLEALLRRTPAPVLLVPVHREEEGDECSVISL